MPSKKLKSQYFKKGRLVSFALQIEIYSNLKTTELILNLNTQKF